MRRPSLPLALLTVLAVALLATAGTASPQPSPICGLCSSDFETTAGEHGVNATVVESTVLVQIHEDGTATWTVRNRLKKGAEAFREDPALLERVARSMAESSPGVTEQATFKSAEMNGDTAVLEYRDGAAAERHAGRLVVDYFHHEGREQWYVVDAEQFTIRGPPGTTVTNDPASGTVDGRTVTWRGSSDDWMYGGHDLEGYPYVVFGDEDSATASVGTTVALASATAPLVLDRVSSFLVAQGVLFALMLGFVGWVLSGREPPLGARELGLGLVVIGGVGSVATAAVYGSWTVPGPAVLAIIVGALAAHPRSRRHLRRPGRMGLAAAVALVATWAVLTLTYVGVERYSDPAGAAVRLTALALPFAAMVPLGGALGGDRREVLAWGGTTVLAFAAMIVLFVDIAGPLYGLEDILMMVGSLLAAFAFPLVGAIVLLVGQSLSDGGPAEEAPARGVDDVDGPA